MAVRPKKDKYGNIIPGWHIIDFYPNGRNGPQIKRQFQGTEADALALEMSLRRAARGDKPIGRNPRLNDCFPDWLYSYEMDHAPTTVKDVKHCLVRLVPTFGPLYFAQLSPATVEQYKKQRLMDGVTKRTINKELSYLSVFVNWCIDGRHCEPVAFRIKKFPPKQTRPAKPRVPHQDEMEAMLGAIEPEYHLVFLLMYDAGLRRSEALNLRAEDVRLKMETIHVVGKGDKERVLPITTDRLRAALVERLGKMKTGYLTVNPKTKKPYCSIRKALTRAAQAAGVSGRVYHHLLRHGFGTHAIVDGVHLRALQGMMGHSTSQVTELYVHLANEHLATEASKIRRPDSYGKKSKMV